VFIVISGIIVVDLCQFKDHYLLLHGDAAPKPPMPPNKSKINKLLRELSDDEDHGSVDTRSAVLEDPSRPW
jgi:hypothetical protein